MADSITSRTLELCSTIQDTLDQWIELGSCFDKLACTWISEQEGKPVSRRDTLRKREKSKTQGLRKRAIAHLEALVVKTGFDAKQINKAIQYYALEQNSAWVGQLKSEAKARELKGLARWHWEGCKLTRDGERSLDAIHKAIAEIGMEKATTKEIRAIVRGILGKQSKEPNLALAAAKAFFKAVEGTDKQEPANPEDVAKWLDILLAESPQAATLIVEACERYVDGLTASQAISKAVA
ncbi:MAG: hypothetical protein ACJ8FY_13745 [Gemmataceae bacterium]